MNQLASLTRAVDEAQKHNDAKHSAKLADMAPTLETAATTAKTPADATRLKNLATNLRSPAA